MYAQDNILCQFGLINLSSVQQLISQPILIHFWWELYQSVSQEEEEIKNSNFEYESIKRPSEDPEEDDRKPAAKRIKKEPEDEAQRWSQEEMTEKPTPKPWEDKKD